MDYSEVISLNNLDFLIKNSGYKKVFISEKLGITARQLSLYLKKGDFTPKSDIVAKLSLLLKVPVSEIVEFKNITPTEEQKEWFDCHKMKYKPDLEAKGELTYAPLWELINTLIAEGKITSAKDVFDNIEPPRKILGYSTESTIKAREARGLVVGSGKRVRIVKGLSELNRNKLRNDRTMSLRTIYEICKYFGCSVDWVIGYK